MKILYHHRTQGIGAEGVHIAYIIKGLHELGHEVQLIAPNNVDPLQTAGNSPYAEKSGMKQKFLGALSRRLPQILFEVLEVFYNFSARTHLLRAVQTKSIDLIYERNAFFLYAGAKIAKQFNIPLIIEVNEIAGEERVRKQFFVYIAKKIEQFVFQQADAIVVVSTFLKQKIASLGIDINKIHVIPNGVDEKLFMPEFRNSVLRHDYNIKPTTLVIGFVGWFVAWHKLDLLIHAFADVAKNSDVRLMLVGDGDLKNNLSDIAVQLNIRDKLIFTGAVKYQKIPEYISAMDICVIPGSNEYRSPIKLFEYMLMGKAVIAPRCEPIEMIVTDGDDALLFASENRAEMTKCFFRFIQNPQLRQASGEKARKKALENHLWIHNSEKVIDIYRDIKKSL